LGLQFFFLLILVIFQLNSPSRDKQLSAIEMLGPLAFNVNQQMMAQAFEDDLPYNSMQSSISNYKNLFYAGSESLNRPQDKYINFEKVVANQKDFRSLKEFVDLFDPSSFSVQDLKLVFNSFAKFNFKDIEGCTIYALMLTPLSDEDILSFLNSDNESANFFALSKVRYNKESNPLFFKAIGKNISRYNDFLRLQALTTLSILHGKTYKLDDLEVIKKGREMASVSAIVPLENCQEMKFKLINEINEKRLPAINRCLREKTLKAIAKLPTHQQGHQLQKLESLGYLEWPLSENESKFVRWAFKF
ncbi:MAG: hypothetical protein WCG27_07305, partial [Pseudomonadota bacterium]